MSDNPIHFTDEMTAPPEPPRPPVLTIQVVGNPPGLLYAIRTAENFSPEAMLTISPLVDKYVFWVSLIPVFDYIRALPSLKVIFFDDHPDLPILEMNSTIDESGAPSIKPVP